MGTRLVTSSSPMLSTTGAKSPDMSLVGSLDNVTIKCAESFVRTLSIAKIVTCRVKDDIPLYEVQWNNSWLSAQILRDIFNGAASLIQGFSLDNENTDIQGSSCLRMHDTFDQSNVNAQCDVQDQHNDQQEPCDQSDLHKQCQSREAESESQDKYETLELQYAPAQSRYEYRGNEYRKSLTNNQKSIPSCCRSSTNSHDKDNSSPLKESPPSDSADGAKPKETCPEEITKKFEEVSFQQMLEETHNDWTARELCNLMHPYLEHKEARFFSLLIKADNTGSFGTILMKALENKILYLSSLKDVKIFDRKWKDNKAPLFILLRHQHSSNGIWKVGGILQVIAQINEVPHDPQWGKYGCQVKFVSTALMEDPLASAYVRPDLERKINPKVARQYIWTLIQKLQEGDATTVSNLFKKPEYTSGMQPKNCS